MATADDFKKIHKELMDKHSNPFKDVKMNEPGGVAARRIAQKLGITIGKPTDAGTRVQVGTPQMLPPDAAPQQTMQPAKVAVSVGEPQMMPPDNQNPRGQVAAMDSDMPAEQPAESEAARKARLKAEDPPIQSDEIGNALVGAAAGGVMGGVRKLGAMALEDNVANSAADAAAEPSSWAKGISQVRREIADRATMKQAGIDPGPHTLEQAGKYAYGETGETAAKVIAPKASEVATNAGAKSAHIKALLDTHSKLVEQHAKLIDSLIKSDAE